MAVDLDGLDDSSHWLGARVVGFANDIFDGVAAGYNLYTVTNTDNSGSGSLRDALVNTADRYIVFDPSLGEATITFTSTLLCRGNKLIDGRGVKITVAGNVFGRFNWQNSSDTNVRIAIINIINRSNSSLGSHQFHNARNPSSGRDRILLLNSQWGTVGDTSSEDELLDCTNNGPGGWYISMIANKFPDISPSDFSNPIFVVGNHPGGQENEHVRMTMALNHLQNCRQRIPLMTDGHLESLLNMRGFRLAGIELRNGLAAQDFAVGRSRHDVWDGIDIEDGDPSFNNHPARIDGSPTPNFRVENEHLINTLVPTFEL